uniref:Secreted protein n=1 Tax=Parastrongyloides trichosuri TaxID=131310 RepID=A0A0N4ZZX2_PARTI
MKLVSLIFSSFIFFAQAKIEVMESNEMPDKYAKMINIKDIKGNFYFKLPTEIEDPQIYYNGFPTFYKDGKELELEPFFESSDDSEELDDPIDGTVRDGIKESDENFNTSVTDGNTILKSNTF